MPLDKAAVTESSKSPSVPSTPPQTTPNRVHRASTPRSRGSSQSPRKRQAKQPLHIRMKLTETQMDKITDAFTTKVRDSPGRTRQRVTDDTPLRVRQAQQMHYSLGGSGRRETSQPPSATFSDLMPRPENFPGHDLGNSPLSIASRRRQYQPTPIQVGENRLPGHAQMHPNADNVSPLSPDSERRLRRKAHIEKEFSQDNGHDPVSPYRTSNLPGVYGQSVVISEAEINRPVLDTYQAWIRDSRSGFSPPGEASVQHARMQSLPQRARRAKSTSEGLRQVESDMSATHVPQSHPPPPPPPQAVAEGAPHWSQKPLESPLFSPLALYFRGQDFPSVKKGEKTLIGDNGWLERPDKVATNGRDKKSPQKRSGIIESIKKLAREVTAEFNAVNRRSQSSAKEATSSSLLSISLDAREQSLLYCELEFHLTTALNDYMAAEFDRGHLVPDNLKRISDWWTSHGRPRVIGFRFDLETQLELVSLHVNDFNFYGRRQSNPVEICGLLDAMKTNARQMRVRTFCQPDSVIAKQLVDAQSLFNLINVSNVQQVALAEIAQFFKVIVERERDYRQRRGREVRKTHFSPADDYNNGDSQWPQQRSSPHKQQIVGDRDGGCHIVEDPLPYAH
ncbi:hypothetical protein CDD81_2501 [Ophiocordyceps australis]|uniref:Uncharacterized protein n=1 Tax=Ophiocordyceps australis TaxID=1399860 RepID=A0A2C5Y9L2_9HYPO|nr:hypothetical protein CDD81_2501 [Ophiocordyceps australis]